MNDRDREIERRAESLITGENKTSRYVHIFEIAEAHGFKVVERAMEESGQILISSELKSKFGTDKLIVVNGKESPRRIRFTVAHELGHYILHVNEHVKAGKEKYYAFRETLSEYSQVEHEANVFASALLMPSERVKATAEKYDSTAEMIARVADRFLVSYDAARVRLLNLGLISEDRYD